MSVKEKRGFSYRSVSIFLAFFGRPVNVTETVAQRLQRSQDLEKGLDGYLNHVCRDYPSDVLDEVRLIGEMLGKVWVGNDSLN